MQKPSEVQIISVDKAHLYQMKEKPHKKIASISISKIGYIISWHEFVPQRISQRLSSIWTSGEAAQLVIMAAVAETTEENARRIAK